MNIIETLKNIDFEKQYVTITFSDGGSISTFYSFRNKEEHLKLMPKLIKNDDNSFTLSWGEHICGFKADSVIRVYVKPILEYTEDILETVRKEAF